MNNPKVNRERGHRLRLAMITRGYGKATALASGLDISPAAITKWTQGHAMSVDHVCNLATLLDISLDWLLMGRNGPDWIQPDQLSEIELDLIGSLRERPRRIGPLLIRVTAEIPKIPLSEQSERL